MNQNKLSFRSENLVVDYFEFKFDVLAEQIKQKIVLSFFELGFNSFDIDKKYRDPIQTYIKTNSKNQHQIQFVVNLSSYWKGVCVAFPGKSAAFFYQLAKEKKIDWTLFDSAPINRFDLNYLRPIHPSQEREVVNFFKQSEETIHSKGINAHIISTTNNLSLKIASKRSNRSAKIYDVDRQGKFLKFEMEIRRKLIANYKSDLLSNHFEKLEDSLIREFLNYFWKLLPLQSKYTDWLSQKVRPIVNNKVSDRTIQYIYTDYIKTDKSKLSTISVKHFIMFLKFIRFTKKLNYEIQQFENIHYRVIIFRVNNFSDECDSLFKSDNNFYKINQVKQFLQRLQQNIFVEIFNDSEYIRSLPLEHRINENPVTFFKQPGSNCLLARVVLIDDLFHYQYPFRFPDLFEGNLTKYEKLVRIQFIQIFSSKYSRKTVNIRQFFNTYKVSNKKVKEIKQIFIHLIKIFQQHQLIEEQALLLTNIGLVSISINRLTTSNISHAVILYERFNTNIN